MTHSLDPSAGHCCYELDMLDVTSDAEDTTAQNGGLVSRRLSFRLSTTSGDLKKKTIKALNVNNHLIYK